MRQPLEAEVEVKLPANQFEIFSKDSSLLKDLLIVSKLTLWADPKVSEMEVAVTRASGEKCVRCWHYEEKLSSGANPGLCDRCLPVVEKAQV